MFRCMSSSGTNLHVNDCASICLYDTQTDEAFFDSEADDDDDAKQKSSLLLHYTLDCLHKIFLYDTHRFLSKERADALLVPLVDQVGLTALFLFVAIVSHKCKESSTEE